MNYSVKTTGLYKAFTIESGRLSTFGALRDLVLKKTVYKRTLLALKDINVEIGSGENIGLIGNNGAGKTTLLKVIAGLYTQSRGEVSVDGDVNYLAGFGIGMIDELSVEENVYLYGAIYRVDKERMRKNFTEIVEWAELQDFVGARLRTLSTGMKTRLAFSITRYVDSDVLLIDEALSAGDKNFHRKCAKFFEDLGRNERTYVFSSHNMDFVRRFCTKTIWLHDGELAAFDDTPTVLREYSNLNSKSSR